MADPWSRDQSIEQLGIDVAAGEHGDRDLALDVDLARKQRGERDRAARLHHQLELAESEGHGGGDLLVADRGALPDQGAVDLEGELTRRLRHQRIADRSGQRRITLAMPAPE